MIKGKAEYYFVLLLWLCSWASPGFGQQSDDKKEKFSKKIIAKGLNDPWTIIYGPDQHLWVTESKGYKVLRVNPADGDILSLLDLNEERQFPSHDKLEESDEGGMPWPQGGLMGMALHPELLEEKPFVYLAYVYEFKGGEEVEESHDMDESGFYFRTRIVRYTYNHNRQTLEEPITICDTIPGSSDHNGGRLQIADVEGISYLFYSVGDMGAGQYENAARPNHAQDIKSYEGKVLRFSTEPANNGEQEDQWIPEDNPFNAARKNAVWSLGHRNPQGLSAREQQGDDILYSSEHGPFSDDEINIIKKGGNYGHPLIIGYADGNYDGLSAGVTSNDSLPGPWNTSYPFIKSEEENSRKLDNYQDPLFSFNPTAGTKLKEIAEKSQAEAEESPEWESVAPSGIAYYGTNTIPSWENSILITSLKQGCMIRLKLNPEGNKAIERTDHFTGSNRYRDVVVSPDGKKIYLVTDKSSVTSGPTAEDPESSDEQGAIIEYSYIKD